MKSMAKRVKWTNQRLCEIRLDHFCPFHWGLKLLTIKGVLKITSGAMMIADRQCSFVGVFVNVHCLCDGRVGRGQAKLCVCSRVVAVGDYVTLPLAPSGLVVTTVSCHWRIEQVNFPAGTPFWSAKGACNDFVSIPRQIWRDITKISHKCCLRLSSILGRHRKCAFYGNLNICPKKNRAAITA